MVFSVVVKTTTLTTSFPGFSPNRPYGATNRREPWERGATCRCNVNCSLWARSLVRVRGKSSQPRKITFPRHILLMWWRLRRQNCSSNLHKLACSQATLIEITVLISGTLFELSLSLTLCCHSLNLQAHYGGTFIVKPPTKTWASTYEHIRLGE